MKEFARRSIAKDSEAAKRLSSLEEAIGQVQVGKPVILLDADHREGEGDFAIAAQFCTPEFINFILKGGILADPALRAGPCAAAGFRVVASDRRAAAGRSIDTYAFRSAPAPTQARATSPTIGPTVTNAIAANGAAIASAMGRAFSFFIAALPATHASIASPTTGNASR